VSRLSDRVARRASPGLDTYLCGLGLSFLYPGMSERDDQRHRSASFAGQSTQSFPNEHVLRTRSGQMSAYHNPRF
jgi:hypothetical protein